jgi:hypothetical protein
MNERLPYGDVPPREKLVRSGFSGFKDKGMAPGMVQHGGNVHSIALPVRSKIKGDRVMPKFSGPRSRSAATDGSVGDFVTSIRTACSLGLAWPGLTALPVLAHPFVRSVEHPG